MSPFCIRSIVRHFSVNAGGQGMEKPVKPTKLKENQQKWRPRQQNQQNLSKINRNVKK